MIKDGDKLSWLSQASRKYSNSTFSNELENQYIRLVSTNKPYKRSQPAKYHRKWKEINRFKPYYCHWIHLTEWKTCRISLILIGIYYRVYVGVNYMSVDQGRENIRLDWVDKGLFTWNLWFSMLSWECKSGVNCLLGWLFKVQTRSVGSNPMRLSNITSLVQRRGRN